MKQPGKVNIVALVTIFGPPAVVVFVVPLLWGRAVTSLVLRCDRFYGVCVALGLLLPGLIGVAVGADMASFLRGMLWGGLIRIFLVHHVTWSINSVCHMVGSAPFATGDHSRNNFVCALLSFGEGWHNNHHAVPYSARHGFSARQPDVAWWFIRACERLGLVWNVRLPDPDLIQRKTQAAESPVSAYWTD